MEGSGSVYIAQDGHLSDCPRSRIGSFESQGDMSDIDADGGGWKRGRSG